MSEDWDWASVRCPKCGKALHDTCEYKAEDIEICPDCGDLFAGDVKVAPEAQAKPAKKGGR